MHKQNLCVAGTGYAPGSLLSMGVATRTEPLAGTGSEPECRRMSLAFSTDGLHVEHLLLDVSSHIQCSHRRIHD
jgi:hypothetical protein